MPSLLEIIHDKNRRLERIPDELLSRIEKTQKAIFNELISLIGQLALVDGKIALTTKNLALVDKIVQDLKTSIYGGDYYDAVKDFSAQFDVQGKINEAYFKEAFTDFKTSEIANAVVKNTQRKAVEGLIGGALDDNFLRPAEKLLTDLVSSGSGFKEAAEAIRLFAEGDGEREGKLLQYSKQIAHDQFALADRGYTSAASDEMESEWFFWSGGDLPTSRCFCHERKGNYYHFKEIEAWGRGENLGDCRSGDLWAGANIQTTEQTIFLYGGGYGCVDSIMPVSIFDVPLEVVQRNIANGNYEPSKFEVEELGL